MSELVDAAPARAFGWMGEPGGDVLEPERVFRKPRDLKHDPPGSVEVGDVDLQTAGQTRPRSVLGIAKSALRREDTDLFESAPSALERRSRRFWESSEVSGKEHVVEVDGRTSPCTRAAQGWSAFAV